MLRGLISSKRLRERGGSSSGLPHLPAGGGERRQCSLPIARGRDPVGEGCLPPAHTCSCPWMVLPKAFPPQSPCTLLPLALGPVVWLPPLKCEDQSLGLSLLGAFHSVPSFLPAGGL